jgi:hypothetical protein
MTTAACAAAHPSSLSATATKIGVRWQVVDSTCTGDDCPGGYHVDVTLIVTQRGVASTHKLEQLSADADDGPTGAQRCQIAIDSVACSGTPEQNQYELAIEGRNLNVLRKDWIDDGDNENGPFLVVEKIPLVGSPPFQLVQTN